MCCVFGYTQGLVLGSGAERCGNLIILFIPRPKWRREMFGFKCRGCEKRDKWLQEIAFNCKNSHIQIREQTLETLESCRMTWRLDEFKQYNKGVEACIYELKQRGLV